LTAERAIHFAIFALVLIGLGSLSAWTCYAYLRDTLILEVAGITLSWGIILLVLYVGFGILGWNWWGQRKSVPDEKSKAQK
jgi:hypothetical protein